LIVKKININQYQIFAEKHKASMAIFASTDWIANYTENQLLRLGVFNDNDELSATFILFMQKRNGISYWTNPPYMPHIGLSFINPAEKLHQQYTYQKKILEAIAVYVNKHCSTFAYFALPINITDSQPFSWHGYKVVPNYTYHLDLKQPIDIIKQNFSSKKRNAYNKAVKDGIQVRLETSYKTLEALINNTFTRKQKNIDLTIIHQILYHFANTSNSFAFTAFQGDLPIASAFCIYDQHTCYYLLSGYDNQYKHNGAGVLAVFECIKHAQSLGISTFDFEGSMLPEVEVYFREFGGYLKPYHTINKAFGVFKKPLALLKPNQF
jgi:lipid II:glycine glycyltransferase (peptidoglycan interpeptide bridge formation enzyme)